VALSVGTASAAVMTLLSARIMVEFSWLSLPAESTSAVGAFETEIQPLAIMKAKYKLI
jgi:hypothetical protein